MTTKIKGEKKRASSRHRISAKDRELWALAMRDVVPLAPAASDEGNAPEAGFPDEPPGGNIPPETSGIKKIFRPFDLDPQIPVRMKETGVSPGPPPPRTDGRTDERLRRGKLPVQARIDLHGHTQAQARAALIHFLLDCHARDVRCALVITGKGRGDAQDGAGGVLRRHFPEWIASGPLQKIVLATHPARARDGGSGAFYVLLRRGSQKADPLKSGVPERI